MKIVDFPIKDGDFPVRYVSLPEGNCQVSIRSDTFWGVPEINYFVVQLGL